MRNATLLRGPSTKSDQSFVRMRRAAVFRVTLKTAVCADGFITMTQESWPRRVEPSGITQVRPSEGAQGSDAMPDSAPPPRAAHDTPTHPPKYSTWDAASLLAAFTGTWTTDPGATDSIAPVEELRRANVETRIETRCGPGLVTDRSTRHPGPPPCGQYQAPEYTCAGPTVDRAR